MAYRRIITDLTPNTLFDVSRNSSSLGTFTSSPQGVLVVNTSLGGGSIVISPISQTDFAAIRVSGRLVSMISPVPGEVFYTAADLRLVTCANDDGRFGGPSGTDHAASYVEFFIDNNLVATVHDTDNSEFSVFKTRISITLSVGTHSVYSRAYWSGGGTTDSIARSITINAFPTYGNTIDLNSNVDWTGLPLSLMGSVGSRIRVNGNGFKYIGVPSSINIQYVDFFNMGASSGFDSTYGIDLSTIGNTTVLGCNFDSCTPSRLYSNNTGTVTISNNVSRSNSRNPLGQTPDYSGGISHGSFPWLELRGNSTGAKTFTTNNFAAGWVVFSSLNWTIGGDTLSQSNIAIGARVGFFGEIGFSGRIKFNFSYHIYYSGWSQASNFEFGGTLPTIEHNIIIGSSWPNRGIDTTFRYNLVLGVGGEEGLIWTSNGSNGDINHNIFRTNFLGRGLLYLIYSATNDAFRNNTIDGINQSGNPLLEAFTGGTYTLNSNLFMNGSGPLNISGASVTRDYNLFYNMLGGVNYSNGADSSHDVTGNPGITGATAMIPFDVKAVWERTLSIPSILSTYRSYYLPTNSIVDNGDISVYGADNPRGAICRSGISNLFDKFGTL